MMRSLVELNRTVVMAAAILMAAPSPLLAAGPASDQHLPVDLYPDTRP